MGAEQSSERGANGDTVKRCYYEVLGVERTATDDEYGPNPFRSTFSQLIVHWQNKESLQKEGTRASP
jgi:hypothetical protein